ncbi:Ca(2+)/H(+) antiporter ChaA [Polycladomyces abyssicola]|uniref:Ca(2+)/H(+) antiporter n=1 Tax=Polycladomyces abyssicola TaxID=1125966 RepID=A0A8D5UIT5_9BACL|nr:calcium/proton exchanger [Polycladomyces abyssicola]BCU82642.1 Ca(2+)/H(+) antiporter ChaA [Polycladomyces abyssicola]
MLKQKWFLPLLILSTLLSIGAHFFLHSQPIQFATACLSLLFWAALLGKATESVAHYAGERLGGLLNATFGNAAELIIAFFLVKAGLFDMVKASITGSIIGNLLLVLGLSVLFGGLRYKIQRFNTMLAGHNASLMLLAVIALFIPAAFIKGLQGKEVHILSLSIAAALIIGYFLWLFFSLVTHRKELGDAVDGLPEEHSPLDEPERSPAAGTPAFAAATATAENEEEEGPEWSKGVSLLLLLVSTAFVALQSEWLVHSVEAVAHALGWSELFVGAFLIAIIGNAAEHSAAVFLAMKNRIGAAVEIAIGSSLQVALFVAPVLVFASYLVGKPMDLVFSGYELAAIAVSAFIASSISRDGSTNWYEGVLLLLVYIILGTAFFVV